MSESQLIEYKESITYDGTTRIETFPFAYGAIREAIYNSIVHRAYNYMNPTQIRVYYNQIVISNDAANVTEDWTEEKLFQKHKSIKYNPLIAEAFFKAGYIETWGRGIQKICDACKENENPLPKYSIDNNDFTVTFEAVAGTAKDGLIYKENLAPGQNTWDVEHGKYIESSQKSSQKIIELIKSDGNITTQDMADKLGISRRAVAKQIAKLQEKNIIRRVGADKGGHWEII